MGFEPRRPLLPFPPDSSPIPHRTKHELCEPLFYFLATERSLERGEPAGFHASTHHNSIIRYISSVFKRRNLDFSQLMATSLLMRIYANDTTIVH
jgi:hypothetical protein